MKISFDWLSDFITLIETDTDTIATTLTEKVAEVDKIMHSYDRLQTVATGKLLEFESISGSDKLHKGTFDCGEHGVKTVIFGKVFPLQKGEIVPIALPGTELPNGLVIKETKMLGVESQGMVCSEAELGTHYTAEGMLRFPEKTTLGTSIIEVLKNALDHVVIGEIVAVEKHPNADKLNVCMVRVGTGRDPSVANPLQIVCGGSNLQKNAKVPVALVGANLWGEIAIKKAKIRDVESNGMICSTEELHVGPSQNKEIMILPNDAPLGQSFFDYTFGGDTVLDIENTTITNRPDLFSHVGFARELAACGFGKLTGQKKHLYDGKFPTTKLPIAITIPKDPSICPRYMAVYISGVDGKTASPEWLQKRLISCGIRPISALVDVTNYVMLEYGVPEHAFDVDRVGTKWNMRLAKKGEKITTLDGVVRTPTEETIVFEDEKNGLFDLCGVMGGENSGIAETTKHILLHGMSYDPIRIRRTAIKVGPRTEASGIFEKTVPPAMVEPAMLRSIQLIVEIFPGAKVASALMDQWNVTAEKKTITLDLKLIQRIAGMSIPHEESMRILEALGFGVTTEKNGTLLCTVPTWREKDMAIPEDIAEEVIRIYGLNEIAESAPDMTMQIKAKSPVRVLEKNLAALLTRNGFYEILTLAFLGEKLLNRAGFQKNEKMIELANPLSEDLSIMRTSLTPRLLETAERNVREKAQFRIFESGKVFRFENGEKVEEPRITALFIGENFSAAKAIAEEICRYYDWSYDMGPWENLPAFMHPGRSGIMRLTKKAGIKIGELHPRICQEFDLPKTTSLLCISLEPVAEISSGVKKIKPLPRFQEIPYDLSVLCERKLPVATVIKGLSKLDPRITSCSVMEVFEGKGVPDGQKSVTLAFEFRAADRTLTDTERDELKAVVLAELEKRGVRERF